MAEKKPTPAKPKKAPAPKDTQRKKFQPGEDYPPEVVAEVGQLVRAGLLKTAEISRRTGVTGNTIQKWKKKFGWKPDLQGRVRREAERRAIVGDLIDEDQAVEEAVAETLQILTKQKRILLRNMDLIGLIQNRVMPVGEDGAAAVASAPVDEDEKIDLVQLAMVGRALADITSKTISDQRKIYNMDKDDGPASFDDMVDEAQKLLHG